jgi:hypothetical protein
MSVCLRGRGAYRRAIDLRLHLNLARLCRFVVRDGFIRCHSLVHAIRELTPVHRCLTFGGGGKHLRAGKQHTSRHNYRYGMHVLNPSRKCAAGKYDEVPMTPSHDARSIIPRENIGLGRIFVDGEIDGYTDSTGTPAYNKGLSERRAQAVADYLTSNGIGAHRLTVKGYGQDNPVADNKTAEGRAHNRRVVLHRTGCGK